MKYTDNFYRAHSIGLLHANTVYRITLRQTVCLFVRLWHSCIVSKQLNKSAVLQPHHSSFLISKSLRNF